MVKKSWKIPEHQMGVSENVVCPIVPNGFADHYPVFKNGYFIGNIPNIFRQTQMDENVNTGGSAMFSEIT